MQGSIRHHTHEVDQIANARRWLMYHDHPDLTAAQQSQALVRLTNKLNDMLDHPIAYRQGRAPYWKNFWNP